MTSYKWRLTLTPLRIIGEGWDDRVIINFIADGRSATGREMP
jgi:hypothetical protein